MDSNSTIERMEKTDLVLLLTLGLLSLVVTQSKEVAQPVMQSVSNSFHNFHFILIFFFCRYLKKSL